MWSDNLGTLKANYDSTVGGPKYALFKADVQSRLPSALVPDPVVKVDPTDGSLPLAVSNSSSVVQVQIFWQLPGEPTAHNYTTTGVIAQNPKPLP